MMEMPHRLGFDTTPPPAPGWDRHLEPEVRAELETAVKAAQATVEEWRRKTRVDRKMMDGPYQAEVATANPMQPIVDVMMLQPARNIILTGIQSDPGDEQ